MAISGSLPPFGGMPRYDVGLTGGQSCRSGSKQARLSQYSLQSCEAIIHYLRPVETTTGHVEATAPAVLFYVHAQRAREGRGEQPVRGRCHQSVRLANNGLELHQQFIAVGEHVSRLNTSLGGAEWKIQSIAALAKVIKVPASTLVVVKCYGNRD